MVFYFNEAATKCHHLIAILSSIMSLCPNRVRDCIGLVCLTTAHVLHDILAVLDVSANTLPDRVSDLCEC